MSTTAVVEQKERCPDCDSLERERIRRAWWMRLIPGSRLYECIGCYRTYLVSALGRFMLSKRG